MSASLGLFELGVVTVSDGGTGLMRESTDTAFITVGDDEIRIEGPRAPAIAAFIVRACNSHDVMLAALQEAERFLDYFANRRTHFVGDGTPATALEMVRAAIAAAESQP